MVFYLLSGLGYHTLLVLGKGIPLKYVFKHIFLSIDLFNLIITFFLSIVLFNLMITFSFPLVCLTFLVIYII